MLVKEIMTKSPICCAPTDTLEQVAKVMLEHDCGAIPIFASTGLVGMITDRDIVCRAVATGTRTGASTASEIMSKPVFTVRDDDDVQNAVNLMKTKQVRRLPVVDKKGKVVGIVAPSDLAPIFASTNVGDFLLAVSYWSRKAVAVT
ncbi:MAG TPA: CBS domain-containing protein [Thermoanaerobaculia bacterium]